MTTEPIDDEPKNGEPKSGDAKPEPRPDPKLLEILVCPVTKGALKYDAAAQELISKNARLAYPIRGGIPIMLPDEARALTDDELKS